MKDSLQRLKKLQRQLETLHRSTTEVLSASQELLRRIEAGDAPLPEQAIERRGSRKKRKARR
jgi:hypothetical protein